MRADNLPGAGVGVPAAASDALGVGLLAAAGAAAAPWVVTAVALLVLVVVLVVGARRARRTAAAAGAAARRQSESAARLAALLAQAPALTWTTDMDLRITSIAGPAVATAGLSARDATGRPLSEVFAGTEPDGAVTAAASRARDGIHATADFRWAARSLQVHVEPWRDETGRRLGTVGVVVDLTDRVQTAAALDAAEHALAESEARFRRLAENAPDVVYRLRIWPDWAFEYISPTTTDVTGWTPDELYSDQSLINRIFDVSGLQGSDRFGLPDEGSPARLAVRHRDGTLRWIDNSATPTYDEEGRLVAIEGIARDVTDRKEVEDRLAHQATHDPLTDLPNRTLLLDRIDQALARTRRSGKTVALLFLDLDHFKDVNDERGHEAGDRLLAAVAARLRHTLRPGDTVARLGGDEFVLCCDDVVAADEARAIASRVRESLAVPFSVGDDPHAEESRVTVTASIGMVLSRADDTPQSLLRAADLAMYRAKQAGRDRVAVHGEERRAGSGREGTVSALRDAVGNGELRLYWQPQYDLTSSGVTELEALLRWQHPTRGVVAAGAFLDLAEEAGVLTDVGGWAIRAACTQAARWGPDGPAITVNVAREQVLQGDLAQVVARALTESGCRADRLQLEFSERVFVDAEAEMERCLADLHALGVGIGIDDYGTASTTRSALARLPLRTMKIDRSLVVRLGHDPAAGQMMASAVELAHTLGLRAVAEGVESALQLDLLRKLGCDAAQGHLFARPQPADSLGPLVGTAAVP